MHLSYNIYINSNDIGLGTIAHTKVSKGSSDKYSQSSSAWKQVSFCVVGVRLFYSSPHRRHSYLPILDLYIYMYII